jgi:hypothetical protein
MRHGLFSGGGRKTKTYRIWAAMGERCHRQNHPHYNDYGGRGITVCDRWDSFKNFLSDMGEAPPGLTIDRIANNGNYEPGNCRWATTKEQNNNRRDNVVVEYQGQALAIPQWAEQTGINVHVIEARLRRLKWSVSEALTRPVHHLSRRM